MGMTTRQPSPFDQPEWHELPFTGREKTHLDKIVDILVQLPSCSSKMFELETTRSSEKSRCLRSQILQQTDTLLMQLGLFSELNDIESIGSGFQATFVALYHTACLICLRFRSRLESLDKKEELRMEDHAKMILECAIYHKNAGLHSGGSFNMSFPLKIACLMSPSEQIKGQAQAMISDWGHQRGLMDLFREAHPLCK